MSSKLSTVKNFVASYWLLIFIVLLVVIGFLSNLSLSDLLTTLLTLQAWQLALLVLVFFLAAGVHISSRKYLLYALGARTGWNHLSKIHFASMAAHYSTPVKIGIPIAIYLFKKIENIPYSTSTAMILMEIAIATSLCGLIALIGIPAILDVSFEQAIFYIILLGFGGIAVIWVLGYFYRSSNKRFALVDYIFNTFDAIRKISIASLISYLSLSLILRVVDGLNLFLLCLFFAEDLTLWQAVITTSTAFFIGTISMVPMGLGTRDISLLLLLQNYGVSGEATLIIVSLQRVLTTGLSFALGIYCGSVLGMKNINIDETSSQDNQSHKNQG